MENINCLYTNADQLRNKLDELKVRNRDTVPKIIGITKVKPKQGRIQDFKLGGLHLKKLRRAEEGANILGVFRVKNHDFTPKNIFFSNFRGGGAKNFGVFRVKNHDFTPKNIFFSNFRGGAPPPPPPPGSAPVKNSVYKLNPAEFSLDEIADYDMFTFNIEKNIGRGMILVYT